MKEYELEKLRKHFLKSDQSNIIKFIKMIGNILYNNFSKCQLYDGKVNNCNYKNWIEKYENIPDEVEEGDNLLEDSIKVFNDQIRWNSLAVMHNLNPPILMDSVIGNMITSIYNPNVLWDFVSANSQKMEKQVVRQIAELCQWNKKKAGGVFTFGGKACLLYAIRIGLNRAIKGYSDVGFDNKSKPVVITSKENHYTIDYVCSFLGIGKSNCIRIPTKNDKMNLEIFKKKIIECMENNIPIAAIILLGGNTINNSIDSVKKIYDIVKSCQKKYNLSYMPYIHFDTVVGWAWLFFKYYNFKENKFDIQKKSLEILKENYKLIKQVKYVDSMGVDFHKIGFAPYQSSVFIIKNKKELFSINKSILEQLDEKEYSNNFTQHYTLEHSRSFAPIYSGWLALQIVGKNGFISYLAYMTEIAFYLRKKMEELNFFWVNQEAKGFASIFWCSYKSDIKFQDIFKWKKKQIKAHNMYIYNLYEVLQQAKYSNNKYVFAYISDYVHSFYGQNIATIRIFPMSMEINYKDINYIVKDIKKIKDRFDFEFKNKFIQIHLNKFEAIPR